MVVVDRVKVRVRLRLQRIVEEFADACSFVTLHCIFLVPRCLTADRSRYSA